MNRGFQAPMDLDDKSSFIGWESPAIAPLIANVETASTATAKRNKAKTSDQVTEAKSTAIGASDSSERQKPTRASKIDNDRIRRENLRKDSTVEHEPKQNSIWTSNFHNNNHPATNNNNSYQAISNHLLLPYIFMGYLRFVFTLFTMGLTVYLIVQFIRTVQHDLEMKAIEYSSDIIQQVHDCGKLYVANKCSPPENRVPAMQAMCSEWESCMQRDPHEIGRLKVGAEAIAEVLNRLFEPLSIKTMIFGSILFFGTLYLYFTAPTFQTLKTLPPHFHHFQDQQQHQQHQQHLQTANSHNLGGLFSSQQNLLQQPSAMASSSSIAGMPQFGVAAGAAQMHHHYYGVNVPGIHSSHVAANDFVVDRNLRRTAANGRGSGGIGTGYTDVGNKMDEDDDDDGE